FTLAHQRYWDANRRAHGDAAGTRALVEVLLAHRSLPAGALVTAMQTAVASGLLNPEVVIIEARRATSPAAVPVPIGAALERYDRPTPSLAGYDDLLTPTARSAP
ncbi:MAG: IS21 family transposase, partial [Dermatophilaceae bacterium]